jgi:hypothetical protein
MDYISDAKYQFTGVVGVRVQNNLDNWILRAYDANPGIINMFKRRDTSPGPLVAWSGEYAGKYLISMIQARRMTNDTRLDPLITRFVNDLVATQSAEGYLGPFKYADRLLYNWDVWGHYHVMWGLLMWHEITGNTAALQSVKKAADLICSVYLNTGKKVLDTGAPEMNQSVIHVLGWLYRLTGDYKYLNLMYQIKNEWEVWIPGDFFHSGGDYYRCGIAGKPFYQTPKPRWESLPDIQGMVELYRITNDANYKLAVENLWKSIAQFDVHPSGAFSTGEQAYGNPYGYGSIETCCTIAWTELTYDALRMTGNSLAADLLDLSTWNELFAAQHPSGRWWTYDTPMNGVVDTNYQGYSRIPGYIFLSPWQADNVYHDLDEFSCCAANSARGIGILSYWAVMKNSEGNPVINFYAPYNVQFKLNDGTVLALNQVTTFPEGNTVQLNINIAQSKQFSVVLRIPQWSKNTTVTVNGQPVSNVKPGQYLNINRTWANSDVVELVFDMSLRHWTGEISKTGRAAL